MQHIKDVLNRYLKQTGLSKNIETALIIKEFEKLVKEAFGSNINKKIKPLYVKDKILRVACLSSVIVQEVNFKKEELIEKINQKFKEEVLKDINFTL